jgi:hypothetical protein
VGRVLFLGGATLVPLRNKLPPLRRTLVTEDRVAACISQLNLKWKNRRQGAFLERRSSSGASPECQTKMGRPAAGIDTGLRVMVVKHCGNSATFGGVFPTS